jgi:hypothetical protein
LLTIGTDLEGTADGLTLPEGGRGEGEEEQHHERCQPDEPREGCTHDVRL